MRNDKMNWKEFKSNFHAEEYAKIAATSQALFEILPFITGPERMLVSQCYDSLRFMAYQGRKV
jgi:hypothetical protein